MILQTLCLTNRTQIMKRTKIKSANGVKGMLIISTTNIPYFRVYDSKFPGGFNDYAIWHSDFINNHRR